MLSGLWWFGTWISVNGNGKAWMVVMVLVRFTVSCCSMW